LSEFLEPAGTAWLSCKARLPEEKRDLLKKVTSTRFVMEKTLWRSYELRFVRSQINSLSREVTFIGTYIELGTGC